MVFFENSDLLRACKESNVPDLRRFIEDHREKEDYNIVDEANGYSPLHYAVESDSLECVKVLLSTRLLHIPSEADEWLIDHITYLDMAIGRDSFEMVCLLLEFDPKFYSIKELIDRHSSQKALSLKMIEVIVETLESMKFPFSIEFMASIAKSVHFRTFDTDKSIEIFKRLVVLVVDDARDGFMHRFYELFFRYPLKIGETLFEWFIAKWYLTEDNEHRNLVQKLMENPQFNFRPRVIFVLHSKIEFIERIPFIDVLDCLLEVDVAHQAVVREVMTILLPKVDLDKFKTAFYIKLRGIRLENIATYRKMTSVEWLDITRLGEQIGIDPCKMMPSLWCFFMPFSTAITADAYLEAFKKKLVEQEGLAALEELRRLDDSDVLAKFCVDGVYRVKCSLKSLCRAEVRRCLLQPKSDGSHKSHSELVNAIRCLELPKCFQKYSKNRSLPASIQQFLLFNYSDYYF